MLRAPIQEVCGTLFDGNVRVVPLVSNVAVLTSKRRRGLGRRVMRACTDLAVDWNYDEVVLEVEAANQAACALYDNMGYQELWRDTRSALYLVQCVIDKASPKLWEACLLGKHIDTVTLSVARQTGGSSGAVEFIKYEVKQTLVTSVSQGGTDGDSLPYENVHFVGVKHTVTYTETDTKGSKKGQVEATYDLSKNK